MIQGVTIAVEIGSIKTLKDGSVSLTVHTPEVNANQAAELFGLRNKVAFCYLSPREVSVNEKAIMDSLDVELKGKTPGQRLRNVLYVYWSQNHESDVLMSKVFEDFYKQRMESIIEGIKQELV
jgi:hypothetical protein